MRIYIGTRRIRLSHSALRYQIHRGERMKFEMDLLRDLLIYIEEKADRPISELDGVDLEGWTPEQVAYHVVLAEEDGLIRAIIDQLPDDDDPDSSHVAYSIQRLTSRGHELLGNIREARHWKAIRSGVEKAGTFTIGAMARFAEAYVTMKAKELIGWPEGQ